MDDENAMNSNSQPLVEALVRAVVATDFVSANADYDNGAAVPHQGGDR
jgi:hypothetical protein